MLLTCQGPCLCNTNVPPTSSCESSSSSSSSSCRGAEGACFGGQTGDGRPATGWQAGERASSGQHPPLLPSSSIRTYSIAIEAVASPSRHTPHAHFCHVPRSLPHWRNLARSKGQRCCQVRPCRRSQLAKAGCALGQCAGAAMLMRLLLTCYIIGPQPARTLRHTKRSPTRSVVCAGRSSQDRTGSCAERGCWSKELMLVSSFLLTVRRTFAFCLSGTLPPQSSNLRPVQRPTRPHRTTLAGPSMFARTQAFTERYS